VPTLLGSSLQAPVMNPGPRRSVARRSFRIPPRS
jgi:hypothetical protein